MRILVPASTANIGPGFDTLGIALALYLELVIEPSTSGRLEITCQGHGADQVSTDPKENLITCTAEFVANAFKKQLPPVKIHCINNIPLGSGLGSSGSAVVAGVCLANELLDLKLTTNQLLDYCLLIEGHPDNVAPSLLGGYIAAFMRQTPNHEESVVLSSESKGLPTSPMGRYQRLGISSEIKAVVATPMYSLSTKVARKVLPDSYSRADVVFNLQRVAVLSNALATLNESRQMIYEAITDKIHQPYRQSLIPGSTEIFNDLNPTEYPGLLGVCISGAGPSVLALAVDEFDKIGSRMKHLINSKGVDCEIRILDIDTTGILIKNVV